MIKKIITRFEEFFAIAALGVMVCVMLLQVLSRYLFNAPLIWSEELTRYLFVWVTFIGAGYGVQKHLHIEMGLLFEKFPIGAQKVVQVLINLLSMVCYGYMIPYGWKFTISQHAIAATATGVPMSFVYAAVPIGCTLVVIRLIIQTFNVITDKVEEREQVLID